MGVSESNSSYHNSATINTGKYSRKRDRTHLKNFMLIRGSKTSRTNCSDIHFKLFFFVIPSFQLISCIDINVLCDRTLQRLTLSLFSWDSCSMEEIGLISQKKKRSAVKKWTFIIIGILTLFYSIAEITIAVAAHSLTLASDGFHKLVIWYEWKLFWKESFFSFCSLSDVLSLAIAYYAQNVNDRLPTSKITNVKCNKQSRARQTRKF